MITLYIHLCLGLSKQRLLTFFSFFYYSFYSAKKQFLRKTRSRSLGFQMNKNNYFKFGTNFIIFSSQSLSFRRETMQYRLIFDHFVSKLMQINFQHFLSAMILINYRLDSSKLINVLFHCFSLIRIHIHVLFHKFFQLSFFMARYRFL